MKIAAAILSLALIVAVVAPAGTQEGATIVKPKVLVHTDVPLGPAPPPQEVQPFGTTLVVNFWVEEAGKKTLDVELRCATPEYRAALTKKTGEFEHHLEVEGAIVMMRDRQLLLLFEAELGNTGQGRANLIELTGSAIMREGEEKVLLKADTTSLHARFAFEAEG